MLFHSGATLEIITDRSQEGAQFVKGFGGIGGQSIKRRVYHLKDKNRTIIPVFVLGILRYQVDFQSMELLDDLGEDFDLDGY